MTNTGFSNQSLLYKYTKRRDGSEHSQVAETGVHR